MTSFIQEANVFRHCINFEQLYNPESRHFESLFFNIQENLLWKKSSECDMLVVNV